MRLPRTTLISLGSELTPLVSSSVLFFLLVGVLPTTEYGFFVTITASAFIVTPIARVGAGVVMLRDIGAGRSDTEAWGDAFNATLFATSMAVLLWCGLGSLIIPGLPFLGSVMLFWQQLVPMAVSELATAYFVVKNDMVQSLITRVTFAGWRIVGLALFWLSGSEDLGLLGSCLLAAGALGAWQNVKRIRSKRNVATRIQWVGWPVLRKGIPDSVSSATGSVLDSVDKPLLTRAGFVADTARYGVAMRLVGLAGVSTLALLRPFDQAVFRAGAESVTATARVMVKATKRTLPAALLGAGGLWAIAGIIPDLLPADYAEATDIIRWSVWMMPMRAVSFPFGNVLTAAGHRTTRLWITAVAAIGNIVANLILIPRYDWKAAVGTTLAAELFMAAMTAWFAWFYVQRERNRG